MTTEYVSLRPAMTVGEAITRIRRTGVDKETIYTCYVTEDRKLLGVVTVKDLLLCRRTTTRPSRTSWTPTSSPSTPMTDQEEVAQMLSKYNFLALPVVDTDGRMVGIVTFDDAMDVMEEEATEDIEKMAAIIPSEKPYLRSNAWDLFKHRIPWLMLLMVSATFTGMIITGFENALAAQVVLTAFIPMLMDTGGNSGSQASVTVIRALSLGELEFRDLPKVIWKEIQTAVLCGVALAALCFAKIMLVDRLLLGNTDITVLTAAAVVCFTMALTVLIAKVVGCTLPMVAKKLGFDPAVMASPFITTIVDALSLLVYFGIASLFPVLLPEDPQALEQQVVVTDDLPLAVGRDVGGKAAGGHQVAGIAQLRLHPLDHAVQDGGGAEDRAGAHAVHRVGGDGLFRRGDGDVRQQAGARGQGPVAQLHARQDRAAPEGSRPCPPR